MKIKLLLLVLLSFTMIYELPAQKSKKKITISGRVTDAYSNPVAGAIIMVDGQNSQWKTNNNGNYKIKIKSTVSSVGVFTTVTGAVEEPVKGKTRIDFKLDKFIPQGPESGIAGSQEDVVDAGYGSSRKSKVATPVSKSDVSGKQYTTFSNIYEMLQTIPGLWVSGNSVSVRGTGTQGNNAPLYVVNGTVVSSVSSINPSTVKSIDVLKGPAASVYGMDGANGVIIINLK